MGDLGTGKYNIIIVKFRTNSGLRILFQVIQIPV